MPTQGCCTPECKVRRLEYRIEKIFYLYLFVAVSNSSSSTHVSPLYLRSSCHRNKNLRRSISGYPGTWKTCGYPGTWVTGRQYGNTRRVDQGPASKNWRVPVRGGYPKGPISTHMSLIYREDNTPFFVAGISRQEARKITATALWLKREVEAQ